MVTVLVITHILVRSHILVITRAPRGGADGGSRANHGAPIVPACDAGRAHGRERAADPRLGFLD